MATNGHYYGYYWVLIHYGYYTGYYWLAKKTPFRSIHPPVPWLLVTIWLHHSDCSSLARSPTKGAQMGRLLSSAPAAR